MRRTFRILLALLSLGVAVEVVGLNGIASAAAFFCDCANLDKCLPVAAPPPKTEEEKKDDKENPPIPPEEFVINPTKYLPLNLEAPKPPADGYVNDKDFPEFDHGSGTAADTPDNIEKGKRDQGKGGSYPEQRRYIRSMLLYGRSNNLSPENAAKFNQLIRDALKSLNKMEQSQYAPDAKLEKSVNHIKKDVNAQNATDTEIARRVIKGIDPNKPLKGQLDAIAKVLANNLGQERSLQLLAESDGSGLARFSDLMEKLITKISDNCDQSQFTGQEILGVARTAEVNGIGTAAERLVLKECGEKKLVEDCEKAEPGSSGDRGQRRKRELLGRNPDGGCTQWRVIRAKAEFAGIRYFATKCADLKDPKTALAGDWNIEITGMLSGSGKAKVGPSNAGTWTGSGNIDVAMVTMSGPVEFVSNPGACQMKLTSSMSMGAVGGMKVTTGGVSGLLPIEVTYQECSQ